MGHTGRMANGSRLHAAVYMLAGIGLVSGCVEQSASSQLRPTLESIQANVFGVHCAVADCHTVAAPESQMNLESGRAYENLVNARSVGLRGMYRVRPGRSDSSYLIRKLTGEGIVGERMPLGRAPLPDSVIVLIRRWIDSGAPPE